MVKEPGSCPAPSPAEAHALAYDAVSVLVITDVGQVTTDWLTGALSRSGALRTGRVRDLGVDAEPSVWSQIVRLRPRYTDDTTGDLPAALLPKICAGGHGVLGPERVPYTPGHGG